VSQTMKYKNITKKTLLSKLLKIKHHNGENAVKNLGQ